MAETLCVDPLKVLSRELLFRVCALLPPADLARLSELSRGWRDLARDERLWADVRVDALDFQLKRAIPDLLRVLLRAPCLGELSALESLLRMLFDRGAKIEQALLNVKKVRSLRGVSCSRPSLRALMLRAAPHLEELEVRDVKKGDLKPLSGMRALRVLELKLEDETRAALQRQRPAPNVPPLPPNLRELTLTYAVIPHMLMLRGLADLRKLTVSRASCDAVRADIVGGRPDETRIDMAFAFGMAPQLEELSLDLVSRMQLRPLPMLTQLRRLDVDHHGPLHWQPGQAEEFAPRPDDHPGLLWLRVRVDWKSDRSADDTMLSLVRAHADTLEELVVINDDPAAAEQAGDEKRSLLADRLKACGLRRLRRLRLERSTELCKSAPNEHCVAQLQALRDALQHCGTLVQCIGKKTSATSLYARISARRDQTHS